MSRITRSLLAIVGVALFALVFQNCAKGFVPQDVQSTGSASSSSVDPGLVLPGSTPTPLPSIPVANSEFKNQWLAMSASGAPIDRLGVASVMAGDKLFTFGGHTVNGATTTYSNQAAMYDPKTNTWQAVSSVGAPSPRTGASIVWTGTKVIVYGGGAASVKGIIGINNGAIYTPATNTWAAISSSAGAEVAVGQKYGKAIWTGTQMIMHGGIDDVNSNSNQGYYVYTLATNSWKRTTANVLSDTGFAMVWTGTKVLVWGGTRNNTGVTAAGEIFDPATGLMAPMSTVGAPSARSFHTGVYAGGKLIIFGGFTGTTFDYNKPSFGDGAMYDMATDKWTAVNTVGAPSKRSFATAVSTGNKMVLYGGQVTFPAADVAVRNDGYIFDPATNSWSLMSAVNNPGAHGEGMVSAWTGTQFIVFGGAKGAGALLGGVWE